MFLFLILLLLLLLLDGGSSGLERVDGGDCCEPNRAGTSWSVGISNNPNLGVDNMLITRSASGTFDGRFKEVFSLSVPKINGGDNRDPPNCDAWA